MTDAVAMRALFERLRFSNPAFAQVFNTQGIASLEELGILNDKEVEIICKLVHSPVGEIENPNAAGSEQPAYISAPGHAVMVVVKKLQTGNLYRPSL